MPFIVHNNVPLCTLITNVNVTPLSNINIPFAINAQTMTCSFNELLYLCSLESLYLKRNWFPYAENNEKKRAHFEGL